MTLISLHILCCPVTVPRGHSPICRGDDLARAYSAMSGSKLCLTPSRPVVITEKRQRRCRRARTRDADGPPAVPPHPAARVPAH